MDKIYSRYRVKVPKIKVIKNGKRIKKIYYICLILAITIFTGSNVLKSIDPIFEKLCRLKAQNIATDITNKKSTEILEKYNYQDTVQMIKSEDGKNSILKTDIVVINQIASDISMEIQKELEQMENQTIDIPAGSLTGSKYFSGSGPKIKIKITSVGEISTDINTEFETAGINQTVYRIYLNLECNMSILTAYKTINETIQNQVLLIETVIVGEVPETYLQME